MNRLLTSMIPLTGMLLLVAGCSSRDDRLTRLVAQQSALNREMVQLNRDVAAGMNRIAQENAEFRKEALIAQNQLHEQRAELIRQQEALAEERRRYAQRDPLVAKAITHVGITLACLLPLALCWYFLSQPADPHLEPAVNELLLEDLTAKQPKLIAPAQLVLPRLPSEPDAAKTGS